LSYDHVKGSQKQRWADPGCGNGTFTLGLASLPLPQNIIYAIGTDLSSLNKTSGDYNSVVLKKHANDFVKREMLFTDPVLLFQ
jgi:predicted RNA methylase